MLVSLYFPVISLLLDNESRYINGLTPIFFYFPCARAGMPHP